jgi:hypothetical protein
LSVEDDAQWRMTTSHTESISQVPDIRKVKENATVDFSATRTEPSREGDRKARRRSNRYAAPALVKEENETEKQANDASITYSRT